IWKATSDGYSIEIRLGWSQLGFAPGKGRTIGWSLGNNDSDNNIGRDYQTVWYGSGNNWSDNSILGDLQLSGGPYYVDGLDEHVLYNSNVVLYPNPTAGNVNVRADGDVFNSNAVIYIADITGRVISQTNANFKVSSTVQLNTGDLTVGIYFVNIISEDGKRAVKKLMVR
ncbi:MAG: T9SS type A sorting domain-containing protein, partial [Bacteroidota bacterium]